MMMIFLFLISCSFLLSPLVFVSAQNIESFTFIDTVTKANLGTITTNGTILYLSEVGSKLTIRANPSSPLPAAASVVFDMDGKQRVRIENMPPYTLAGDTNGNVFYASSTLSQSGIHTVSATRYSQRNGKGIAGSKFTIQFTTAASSIRRPTKAPTMKPSKPPTDPPTLTPIKQGTEALHCGCILCTENVWNAIADGFTCGERITWVINNLGASERDACIQLSTEFPTICGVGCNSATCGAPLPPTPVATSPAQSPVHCECSTCTDDVWNRSAEGPTCGARITWIKSVLGKSERDACIDVSSEFPAICGSGCNSATCGQPQPSPVATPPVATPIAIIPTVAAPVAIIPTITVGSSSQKCGGAVNTGLTSNEMCTKDLWNPTGDTTQHCFAYGGASDPCALHNNNDIGDGLLKNPSACAGNTFYLWDEPDTQGKNYTWAGIEWVNYATRFSSEIQTLRARGVQFTSPLLKAGSEGAIVTHLNTFYAACGAACHDPESPAYININAINAFAGPWNSPGIQGCRDGASFVTNEMIAYNRNNAAGSRPWYVTNWSRLGTYDILDQVDAINAIEYFFASGSPVQRIYWFGATDYGGNSGNNFLTASVTLSNGVTTTLGQLWKSKCDTL